MPRDAENSWFETTTIDGRRSHYSKFSRGGFGVSLEFLKPRWASWSPAERRRFAGAFGLLQRSQLGDDDQNVLDFLMADGGPQVWRAIALVVAKHRDRTRALAFLIARVHEEDSPVANYYQALEKMSARECVPALRDLLSKHREDLGRRVPPNASTDRFFYQDYLVCSATLFKLTGEEQYLQGLKEMLAHSNERIRTMVQTISNSYSIKL